MNKSERMGASLKIKYIASTSVFLEGKIQTFVQKNIKNYYIKMFQYETFATNKSNKQEEG